MERDVPLYKGGFYPLARLDLKPFKWLRRLESNQVPLGYEPSELPMLHGAKFCLEAEG